MSFVFRGSRADIEAGGFPGFAPERRAMRIHAGSRPVNSNSLAFLLTVLVLFMVLNSHQMFPNFLDQWGVQIYPWVLTCEGLVSFQQDHRAVPTPTLCHLTFSSSGCQPLQVLLLLPQPQMLPSVQKVEKHRECGTMTTLGGTKVMGARRCCRVAPANCGTRIALMETRACLRRRLSLRPPPRRREWLRTAGGDEGLLEELELASPSAASQVMAVARRRQAIRPRSFSRDYDALRALDADNSPHTPMSEEEINALPVFKYKVQAQNGNASGRKSDGLSQLAASSTGSGNEKKQDGFKADGTSKTPEDELTCSVCLEQVAVGDLLRSLPCLHQFTAHPDYMLQPHNDDLERIYNVLEQYDDLMKDELIGGDVYCSAAHIMDEKLYSNGVDDFQILPTGQTGYHSEKKLTIDQEFEQYFSNLML